MNSKKIYLYLFTILSFLSCDSFLEEDPKSIISPDFFFTSASDARQAITGIYAVLKNNSIYGQLGLDHFYDNGADIIEPNRSISFLTPIGNYSMNESIADQSVQKMGVADTWRDLYRVIFNANTVISRLTDSNDISKDSQIFFIAEARFLRALAYWHITNLWGDAPFYQEELLVTEIAELPRTPEATIIESVLQDLNFAQQHLPSVVSDENRGRASKWAAATIAAKIYMQQQNWQLGLAKCEEIINQSSHSLLRNYADVFDPSNEFNSEIIWSLDFARDLRGQFEEGVPRIAGNGNWRPSMFNPRLRDEPKNTDDRDALRDTLKILGQSFNGTGLQVASQDFAEKFPQNDLRRPLNVLDEYLGFELNFPYMPKNMNLELSTSPRFNHSDNRIVFRLADIYLMAAECANEINGPTGTALGYIHEVRKRAYINPAEWDITGVDQQGFRQAIYDERKWELAGEGHRRYDLIRWGILLDVVQNLRYRETLGWTPNDNIKTWHVKLPIPLQDLQLNPALLESDPSNNGYR